MKLKSAFTLIELLVYMAIMGFIIVVAGRVFSDSTGMRVRSQNMVKSAEIVGKVSDLLKEDISQMGIKAWGENTYSTDYKVYKVNDVYWNDEEGDFSSYALEHEIVEDEKSFDKLVFKKVAFGNDGTFYGVRAIQWSVENGNLFRRCITIGSCVDVDDECGTVCSSGKLEDLEKAEPMLIAEGVEKFTLMPSKPGEEGNDEEQDILFPPPEAENENFKLVANQSSNQEDDLQPILLVDKNNTITEVKFSTNNTTKTETFYHQACLAKPDEDDCFTMKFLKNETYIVEFGMPFLNFNDDEDDLKSTQFLPGIDHVAVGLRKKDFSDGDNDLPIDVQFYPPQGDEGTDLRYAEFSMGNEDKDLAVVLTFAFYSPQGGEGKLRFWKFKVTRKADKAFHFPKDDPNYGAENMASDKKIKAKNKVKAFNLEMKVNYKGEIAGTKANDDASMIILTPNNGIEAEGLLLQLPQPPEDDL